MPRTAIKESFTPERLAAMDGKPRIIARNTFQYTEGDKQIIRLHYTDIAEKQGNNITLNTNGWLTVTTKDRLNFALERFGFDGFIASYKGVWYVHSRASGKQCAFYDGMVLPWAINGSNPAAESEATRQRDLKKKIGRFLNKTMPTGGTIPSYGRGDCFLCQNEMAAGPAKQESNGHTVHDPRPKPDAGHILTHLDEGYLTGSLVVNALRFAGAPEGGIAIVLNRPVDAFTRGRVRRYIQARLGLTR